MSENNINWLEKYIQQRIDTGEEGFWVSRNTNSSDSSEAIEKLERLRGEAEICRSCRLGHSRLNSCFGGGSVNSGLMFIGEGPGYNEDHEGKVFIGRAGRLLDKIIESTLGLARADVYVTNIVKCHPMKDPSDPEKRGNDRPPEKDELSACINKFLYRQIELIRPAVIVTLGGPATKTILDEEKGITKLRGRPRVISFGNHLIEVIPTYHPAYLLRSPNKKKEFLEDMKLVRSRF